MEPVTPATGAAGASSRAQSAVTPALRKAAQDFEAIFVHQLLSTMRQASLPGTGSLGSSAQRIYQDVMDDEVARSISRAGGLGLAELLIRDVARRGAGQKGLKSPASRADDGVERAGTPEGGAR